MNNVTMEDIQAMKDDWLTPATVASVLHMNPGRLIWYAKNGQLPFPAVVSGTRVKISRIGFLKAYGYIEEEQQKNATVLEELKAIRELLAKVLERRG